MSYRVPDLIQNRALPVLAQTIDDLAAHAGVRREWAREDRLLQEKQQREDQLREERQAREDELTQQQRYLISLEKLKKGASPETLQRIQQEQQRFIQNPQGPLKGIGEYKSRMVDIPPGWDEAMGRYFSQHGITSLTPQQYEVMKPEIEAWREANEKELEWKYRHNEAELERKSRRVEAELERKSRRNESELERRNRIEVAQIRVNALNRVRDTEEKKAVLKGYRGKLAEYKEGLRSVLSQGGLPKFEKGQIVGYDPIPPDLISKYLKQIEYLDKRLISEKWDENDELAFMDLEDFFTWYQENAGQLNSTEQSPDEGMLSKLYNYYPTKKEVARTLKRRTFTGEPSPGANKKQPQDRFGILELLESR